MERLKMIIILLAAVLFVSSCGNDSDRLMGTLKDDFVETVLHPLSEGTCMTSPFGRRNMKFHNGIDLRTKHSGTPVVFAIADGIVINSAGDQNTHSGEYIKIFHPELKVYSIYAHLSSKYVFPGDSVERNEMIGVAGETGRSRGEHLHFGMKAEDNKFIDPQKWLAENYVFIKKCD